MVQRSLDHGAQRPRRTADCGPTRVENVMILLIGIGVLFLVVCAVIFLLQSAKSGVDVVHLKPPTPGQPPVGESPEELLRAGKKIEAIKRYRELTGASLKEAKDAIELVESGRSATLPPKSALLRQVNDSEIEAQIRSGHMIDAIKLYREKNGVGLKEAKDAVEAWRDRIRAS